MRFGRIELRIAQRQVLIDGKASALGARAFDVLLALVAQRGSVVTKAQLFEAAWPGVVVEENNLQVQISVLRRALGPDAIATVPGRGYQFTLAPSEPLETRPGPVAPASPSADLAQFESVTTLAVLPFDNLSRDPAMEFFSDGVSEDILYAVARAKGLRVIGKSSSFQFRGADKSAHKIKEALRATHLLDGSVRRTGDNIRVSAQLVETGTQTTLWAERYDRPLTDIFALQDEVAAAIAAALNAHLAPARSQSAIDPVAYELYLRARAAFSQDIDFTLLNKTVELLEECSKHAPEFAQAWGMRAAFRASGRPRRRDEQEGTLAATARHEAEKALSLDAGCSHSYIALALLKPRFSDYGEKVRLMERGFKLAPADSWVGINYAATLAMVGRGRDSCRVWTALAEQNPLAPAVATLDANYHRSAGFVETALERIERARLRFPDSRMVASFRAMILAFSGETDLARTVVAAAPAGFFPPTVARLLKQMSFADEMPRREQAASFEAAMHGGPDDYLFMATCGIAAGAGHADLAFKYLETAIDSLRPIATWSDDGRGVPWALTAVTLFTFVAEALRRDPRFARLCVKIGLDDYWRESGLWPDCVEEVAPFYDFKAECAKAAQDEEAQLHRP